MGDDVDLYCADAIEATRHLKEPCDLVITDPPYAVTRKPQLRGSMRKAGGWFGHDSITPRGAVWFLREFFLVLRDRITEGGHLYIFSDWMNMLDMLGVLESSGYLVNQSLVWRKTRFGIGQFWRHQHEHIIFASAGKPAAMLNHSSGTVLDAGPVPSANRYHPAEKPVSLIENIIRSVPGRRVMDPFMGAGSTGVAAIRSGRRFVGIDIEQRWVDIARRRIAHASKDLFTIEGL